MVAGLFFVSYILILDKEDKLKLVTTALPCLLELNKLLIWSIAVTNTQVCKQLKTIWH